MVEATGFAPWADAHGKQRVSAVLSSVDTSDLRKLCLLASPQFPHTSPKEKKHRNRVPVFLVEVTGLEARKKATKRQFFSYFGAKTAHFYAFCKLCPQLPNIKSP